MRGRNSPRSLTGKVEGAESEAEKGMSEQHNRLGRGGGGRASERQVLCACQGKAAVEQVSGGCSDRLGGGAEQRAQRSHPHRDPAQTVRFSLCGLPPDAYQPGGSAFQGGLPTPRTPHTHTLFLPAANLLRGGGGSSPMAFLPSCRISTPDLPPEELPCFTKREICPPSPVPSPTCSGFPAAPRLCLCPARAAESSAPLPYRRGSSQLFRRRASPLPAPTLPSTQSLFGSPPESHILSQPSSPSSRLLQPQKHRRRQAAQMSHQSFMKGGRATELLGASDLFLSLPLPPAPPPWLA